ncbi:MAG: ribbon-helix-helix protein, CopG family [Verrucomicrobiota bacterium]
MLTKTAPAAAPLTFDLPLELIARLELLRKRNGLNSTSAIVRLALREFDFGNYRPPVSEHRQISVRLAPQLRKFLTRTARKKKVSLGELLRAAVEGLAEAKGKK